jgi:hypothetical protein
MQGHVETSKPRRWWDFGRRCRIHPAIVEFRGLRSPTNTCATLSHPDMVGPVKGYPGFSVSIGLRGNWAARGGGNATVDQSDIRGLVTGMGLSVGGCLALRACVWPRPRGESHAQGWVEDSPLGRTPPRLRPVVRLLQVLGSFAFVSGTHREEGRGWGSGGGNWGLWSLPQNPRHAA